MYKGETYIDMKLTTSLVNEFVNVSNQEEKATNDPFKILSKRELEILPLIARDMEIKKLLKNCLYPLKQLRHIKRIL